MNIRAVYGPTFGVISGIVAVVSPVGDMPLHAYLKSQGVINTAACIKFMSDPSAFYVLHPCFPLNSAQGLDTTFTWLMFIAVGLLIWGGYELFDKLRHMG
jgi:hypothetical protein